MVRFELDETGTRLKPTLHDQSMDGDVTVCGFQWQLTVHQVVVIMTVIKSGSLPLSESLSFGSAHVLSTNLHLTRFGLE